MRIALLALLLAPTLAFAQAGRFLLTAGEVVLVRGALQTPAAAGGAVQAGDTIRVGPQSNAQVRMSDGSIIALRSNTEFRIDEYAYSGRGDDSDRSVFSLVKGGLRTVTGAIGRRPSEGGLVRTAAPATAPQPDKQTAEPAPREEGESKLTALIQAPLRAVTAAARPANPNKHAVRVPTGLVGIRGTHYTLVHCDNDCFMQRRTSVAALLAQSDAGAPGVGDRAPNGTYGSVSDGGIDFSNSAGDRPFGAHEYFYVASVDSVPQTLIAPPGFLYDRLEGQERARGQTSTESTETMALSGLNAESRPGEPPVPPAPEPFIVTEQRDAVGNPLVLAVAPTTALLTAFDNLTGGPATNASFVDASALTTNFIDGVFFFTAFNVPAGSSANPAGNFSGSSTLILDETTPNALNAYWGIWFDGGVTDGSGTTTIGSSTLFHYLAGPLTPPEVISAKTGAFAFRIVAGTTPTDNTLQSGAFSTSLNVDFTARNVSSTGSSFTFSSSSWAFGGVSMPIQISPGRGAFVNGVASGSCSGSTCGTSAPAQLNMTGTFMGPVGDHLGMAFNAKTTSGPAASAQTVKIFSCSPTC